MLKTNFENELIEIGVHNHLKNEIKFNKVLLQQKIKTRSLSTKESGRNVVLSVLRENSSLKIPVNLPKLNSLVRKIKNKHDFSINKDYGILSELQVTLETKNFFILIAGWRIKVEY